MAFIQQDEEKRPLEMRLAGPPAQVVGMAGGAPAKGAAPKGSGFVNIGRYLGANVGQGERMVNAAAGDGLNARATVDAAMKDATARSQDSLLSDEQANNFRAQGAEADQMLARATTTDGVMGVLGQKFGNTTAGGGALDAALVQSDGKARMSQLAGFPGVAAWLGQPTTPAAAPAGPGNMAEQRKVATHQGHANAGRQMAGMLGKASPGELLAFYKRRKVGGL